MTRRELREHCFKMLFSADFYPTQEEAIAQLGQYFQSPEEDDVDESGVLQVLHKVELNEADSEYLRARTANIMERIPEIDGRLNLAAAGWKTKRMGKVELTILRLALYEMVYDNTIPEKVSINEAVELAKKFGGNDSSSFVNGILAKFVGKCSAGSAAVKEAGMDADAVMGVEDEPAADAVMAEEVEPAADAAVVVENEPAADTAVVKEDEPAADTAVTEEIQTEAGSDQCVKGTPKTGEGEAQA